MRRPKRELMALVHKVKGYDVAVVDRPAGERWVTMSNALIRAGHGLTLAEKRIIAIAISKLHSHRVLRPGEVPRTKITASEYAELAECSMPTAYEALEDAAKKLFERKITFYEPAHKRNGKPLPPTRVQMRWVSTVKYQDGEGWVEVTWCQDLLPHLTGLRRHFTSYQLRQASALRSAYSWRLLELLSRFEDTGWAEYAIEDFCTAMDATEKQKKDFFDIRRRIIEPAVAELTQKDGWLIQWMPIKKGRKVAAVRFTFMRDPQGRLPI